MLTATCDLCDKPISTTSSVFCVSCWNDREQASKVARQDNDTLRGMVSTLQKNKPSCDTCDKNARFNYIYSVIFAKACEAFEVEREGMPLDNWMEWCQQVEHALQEIINAKVERREAAEAHARKATREEKKRSKYETEKTAKVGGAE